MTQLTAMKNFLVSLFSSGANRDKTVADNEENRRAGTNYQNVTIELAVFVDSSLFRGLKETFPDDTDRHVVNVVSAMLNAVQILFDDEALGHKVALLIKRIEVMKEEPNDLGMSDDIETLLTNFCQWQQNQNMPNGHQLHWDHAILLTGQDLKSLSKRDGRYSKKIVGLSPVSGMCNGATSCMVSEGSHFESVFVIAHELGHNLGMKHDGRNDLNECDPGAYLMSPTLGSDKNTWSSCSKNYLTEFLT